MICVKYGPDSNVSSPLNFPVPTEAFKHVSKLTTKDERVRALKIYWTPIMHCPFLGQSTTCWLCHKITTTWIPSSPLPLSLVSMPKQRSRTYSPHPPSSLSFIFMPLGKKLCSPSAKNAWPIEGNKSKKAPPFHPRRCLSILTPLFPIWQMSSVQFSACSIVLLPRPLHAPCCTTAS